MAAPSRTSIKALGPWVCNKQTQLWFCQQVVTTPMPLLPFLSLHNTNQGQSPIPTKAPQFWSRRG